MHIAIVAEHRYLTHAQPSGLSAALKAAGHDVALINPQVYEAGDGIGGRRYDLVVARGRSWPVLCLLAAAEARAIPVINTTSSISAVHNKAEMASRLAYDQVPIPRTFVGEARHLADQVPERCYPIILKPIFGDNGCGLRILRSRGELAELEQTEEIALAQCYLPNDGYDLKLYGIGDDIWLVRKRSPLAASPDREAGAALAPLTPELEHLARRCRRIFGLHLFGVDCIETGNGPVVIEVNEFPSYSAVPDADQALARYVVAYAEAA